MNASSLARRLARHFEGWQLGLLVVSMALLSALLVVPRNVPPELVPPPVIACAPIFTNWCTPVKPPRIAQSATWT